MLSITRSNQSDFFDNLLEENGMDKKSFSIERLSNGLSQEDPFADRELGNVWNIKGNKLLKNKEFQKGE